MIKKFIRYLILGLGLYALIATLVITFYKDDPQAMIWQDREAFNDYLGSPDLTYAKRNKDQVWQIVFYRTQHQTSDGITTMDECTGLLFKNGELFLWGPSAYTTYQEKIR